MSWKLQTMINLWRRWNGLIWKWANSFRCGGKEKAFSGDMWAVLWMTSLSLSWKCGGCAPAQSARVQRGTSLARPRNKEASVAGAPRVGGRGWEELSARALLPQRGCAFSSEKIRNPAVCSRGVTHVIWLSYKMPVQSAGSLFSELRYF